MGRFEGKGCFGRSEGWRAYVNVNLETIVVLCNWVEGMNSAKCEDDILNKK